MVHQSFWLVHIAPIHRAFTVYIALFGLIWPLTLIQEQLYYLNNALTPFSILTFFAVSLCLLRVDFYPQKIEIKWSGVVLKRWTALRMTTRQEKKLHRVYCVQQNGGALIKLPLLLNLVPVPLLEPLHD
ncbi:hypothetical protein AT705_24550 (plasmid) [Pseudoalteromonas rubra]|uniref:Uncharacterized protein n=1 Tax=Pseudoalteromonas rubra TaxID=43658 RepID=A0A0U3HYI2_9GAMM|nr:hypothetical protein AT705_24550 [Pseudoalteromonas rubra]